ncbi:hypothetical protein AAA64_23345 [Salmonella enterica subsp. enterica serovar Dublin]|jgi:hypothetical protein|nr:hypothetical protein [Salmonella enterica subsp. enterica serovar Dublin]DAY64718.1 MAG TPA: hypothetical protein [Caudoviricetes sp.]
MWLSAIHRDLPKTAVSFAKKTPVPNVGVAKFERVEEGQFVVTDHKENEFMLYHPEVDTSEICEGVFLLSWQDPETKEWKWCTAKPLKEIENGYGIGEIYVEPEPH